MTSRIVTAGFRRSMSAAGRRTSALGRSALPVTCNCYAGHEVRACTATPPTVLPNEVASPNALPVRYTSSAQQQQSRQKEKMAPPPRDTRLAGRRRFYNIVGIEPSSPPWEQRQLDHKQKQAQEGGSVDSPISAGVDGTQSATGVTNRAASAESMRDMLNPCQSGGAEAAVDWFSVTLDGKTLRTPLGLDLTIPSSALALAIAAEWDSQDPTIVPASMPLTTMVCTAIDQISSQPQFSRDNILRYLKNDTVCYLSDPAEDRVLYRKQMKAWEELHKWAQDHLGGGEHAPARAIGNDEGLIMSRARKSKPGAGLPHPDVLVEEAEAWVSTLDAWRLIAMQAVTVEAKSFLVGMAVVRGCEVDHYHDENVQTPPYSDVAKDAVEASRVEEEFNIEQWGLVEGGHDYDRLNCSINIHAATFLVSSIASPS